MLREIQTFWGLLAIVIVHYGWNMYTYARQRNTLETTTTVPPEVSDNISLKSFKKRRRVALRKIIGVMRHRTLVACLLLGDFWINSTALVWSASRDLTRCFGKDSIMDNEVVRSVVFYQVICTFGLIYRMLGVTGSEGPHGETWNEELFTRMIRKTKKFVRSQVYMLPVVLCVAFADYWRQGVLFAYVQDHEFVWFLLLIGHMIQNAIYKDLYKPLVRKRYTLPQGPLRDKIEAEALKIGFPTRSIFMGKDGPKGKQGRHAYFRGLYNDKHIVICERLIHPKLRGNNEVSYNDDEVLAVVGHELGHWYYNHSLKNFIFHTIKPAATLILFFLMNKHTEIYKVLGITEGRPAIVGFQLMFQYVFFAWDQVNSFLFNALQHHFEYQADSFSKKLGNAKALRSSLLKSPKFPLNDRLFTIWHRSHPCTMDRINALMDDKTE